MSNPTVSRAIAAYAGETTCAAFMVSGGGVAELGAALLELTKQAKPVVHSRREDAAAYQGMLASQVTGRPAVTCVTTGAAAPIAAAAILSARADAVKLLLLSGHTDPASYGRGAIQHTEPGTMPAELYRRGNIFDFAELVSDPRQLPRIFQQLDMGFSSRRAFVAHLAVPLGVQGAPAEPYAPSGARLALPGADQATLEYCAEAVTHESFAIVVGSGAALATDSIRRLQKRTGARVFATPRAKGIVPQAVGIGLGGSEPDYAGQRPRRLLVLGSRLSEASCFWDEALLPSAEIVHVDLDSSVFGASYTFRTLGVVSDIGLFVDGLLARLPQPAAAAPSEPVEQAAAAALPASAEHVHPAVLMAEIQQQVVDATDYMILAESGNSTGWAAQLRFSEPSRYQVNTQWGSLGHACAGVVGAALVHKAGAIAITGDGAMLYMNEVSTAAAHGIAAKWIVLNDSQYGSCVQGNTCRGLSTHGLQIPRVDFALAARALGAQGSRVSSEAELAAGVAALLKCPGPYVLDVLIDNVESPLMARFKRFFGSEQVAVSRP